MLIRTDIKCFNCELIYNQEVSLKCLVVKKIVGNALMQIIAGTSINYK